MRALAFTLLCAVTLAACGGSGTATEPPGDDQPDAGTDPTCTPDCSGRACGLDPRCGTVCGTCDDGACSTAGVCEPDGPPDCTPRTCAEAGAECGVVDDGCNHALTCNTCGAGETCGAITVNQCDVGTCTPRTCLSAAAECGALDDGCGNPLACGPCLGGEVCGAGGQPNVCSPPPATWASISTGGFHTCGVKSDGTLWCWGRNNAGQVGLGTTGGTVTTPQRVGVSFGWTEVAAGGFHTCGINYDHLYCWGENENHQLGDGTTIDQATPKLIQGAKTWDLVKAGWNATCARAGDAYCWGNNQYQQLTATLGDVATPLYVGDIYTQTAVGGAHVCFQRDGVTSTTLSCGGLNASGQLGTNSGQQQQLRASVFGSHEWNGIWTGGQHTCAFANVGTLFCWGNNAYGQLGNPVAVGAYPDYVDGFTDWKAMGLGDVHTCGIKTNGNLYCWGANDAGQLGDGTSINRDEPALIGSSFAKVAGGYAHTCAIDVNGALWCWGSSQYGQLGTGGPNAITPTAVH